MPNGSLPSERTLYDALNLYKSDEFRTFAHPDASEAEIAQDAASFAILDAMSDGEPVAGIQTTADIVLKLAKDI